MKHIVLFLLSASSVVFLCSCSSNSTTPDNFGGTHTVIRPGPGSAFVVRFDSANGAHVFDTMVILDTGLSFAARTGVIRYTSSGVPNYMVWESNGDRSAYKDESAIPGGISGWLRYPLAGGPPESLMIKDTILAGGVHHTVSLKTTYLKSEGITVQAGTFNTAKIAYNQYNDGAVSSGNDTIWYDASPDIPIRIKSSNAIRSGTLISKSIR